jgi:predicted  nucleic acid-binding Zn-ribbon protein
MGKLDVLWAYQKTDMEVSRFENEMRRDPTRNKLLRLRNFVVEQQNTLQTLEQSAVKAQKRVADLEVSYQRTEKAIENGGQKIESGAYTTLEDVQAALREAQKLLDSLKSAERELKSIASEAEKIENKLRDIRSKVAQARTQYNNLKEGYDKTFAEQSGKLNGLKQKRERAGKGIDEALLKRYESIKKQYTQQPVPQPMAKLLGDQCGGCNMSLPAVVLKRVKDDENVVECENCGRILYLGKT